MSDFEEEYKDILSMNPEGAKEVVRLAEKLLDEMSKNASAADLRAVSLTGIFGGAAVALFAAGAAALAYGSDKNLLATGSFYTAFWLLLSAIVCAFGGRPSLFNVSGNEPRNIAHLASDKDWLLRYTAKDLQIRINANRYYMKKAADLIKAGMFIALFAVLSGSVSVYMSLN